MWCSFGRCVLNERNKNYFKYNYLDHPQRIRNKFYYISLIQQNGYSVEIKSAR